MKSPPYGGGNFVSFNMGKPISFRNKYDCVERVIYTNVSKRFLLWNTPLRTPTVTTHCCMKDAFQTSLMYVWKRCLWWKEREFITDYHPEEEIVIMRGKTPGNQVGSLWYITQDAFHKYLYEMSYGTWISLVTHMSMDWLCCRVCCSVCCSANKSRHVHDNM